MFEFKKLICTSIEGISKDGRAYKIRTDRGSSVIDTVSHECYYAPITSLYMLQEDVPITSLYMLQEDVPVYPWHYVNIDDDFYLMKEEPVYYA